jgi:hypothetical protein
MPGPFAGSGGGLFNDAGHMQEWARRMAESGTVGKARAEPLAELG